MKKDDPLRQAPTEELLRVLEARREHLVPVDQPLVLISQIGRSGGTLLMRLLDGHPQCHTIPHEFVASFHADAKLLEGADQAWEHLQDTKLQRRFEKGVRQSHRRLSGSSEAFPMVMPPSLQRHLFETCLATHPSPTPRNVLDCYMTSYFNAWLDNQNLYSPEKLWVTAFAPAFLAAETKVQGFDATYPDGRILSMVRDPAGWYTSARVWNPDRWGDREKAMDEWCESVSRALSLKGRFGPRFLLLTFEDMVANPKVAMRSVTDYLGLRWVPELLVPTFNGLPIKANSSFKVTRGRLLNDPLERHKELLEPEDAAYVEQRGRELYEEVRSVVGGGAAEPTAATSS